MKHIQFFLLILTLCTACIYKEKLFGGINTSKSIWFILVVGLMTLIAGVSLTRKKKEIKLKALDISITAFWGLPVLHSLLDNSIILSKNVLKSTGLVLFYFFAKEIYKGSQFKPLWFIVALLLLTVVQISLALLQYFNYIPSFNPDFTFTGLFINPSPYSIFLAALLCFCLTVFLFNKNNSLKRAGLMLLTAGVPILIATLSRAAWAGFMLSALLLIHKVYQRYLEAIKRIKAKLIVVLTCVVLICITGYSLYGLKKDSADGRLLIWKISMNMISSRPFTGVGTGNFPHFLMHSQAEYFKNHPDRIYTEGKLAGEVGYAFNDCLQFTAEHGAVGLIVLVVLLFFIIKVSVSAVKWLPQLKNDTEKILTAGSIAIITVILFSGFFTYPLTVLPIQILFVGSVAFLSSRSKNEWVYQLKPVVRYTSTLILIAIGALYINYAVRLYSAYTELFKVDNRGFEGNDIQKLRPHEAILNQEGWYRLMKGEYLFRNKEYTESIKELETAKGIFASPRIYYSLADAYAALHQYHMAEVQYRFLCNAIPNLLRPRYQLAKLYYETGQTDRWKTAAEKVMSFVPKVQSEETDQMKAEIKLLLAK